LKFEIKTRLFDMYKLQKKNIELLQIGLASPKEIRSWAERFLPNGEIIGEVTSWETVNYKTLKPETNGLFCQKIFGPIVDYTCACGKKAVKLNTGFCSKCGVERTTSQVRRYRMGYIQLNQPVVHTLYATEKPSPLARCLNWPNKKLQAILYATEFCNLSLPFQFFCKKRILQESWEKSQQKHHYKISFKKKKIFPRLFQKTKSAQSQWTFTFYLYYQTKLSSNLHIYGVSHDASWREVDDFRDFLLYMWENPSFFHCLIPYYFWKKRCLNFGQTSIPKHETFYPIQTGGIVFQKLLSYYNVIGAQRQLILDSKDIKQTLMFLKQKEAQIRRRNLPKPEKVKLHIEIHHYIDLEKRVLRRLMYFRDFYKTSTLPAWMMLSYLPVLPPGLRPITSIRGELIVSDLNSLYRKVLTRNRRLINTTRFQIFDTALSGSWASWCYNLRQVQEAIDSLLKTGKIESGKPTKSLLDALKGKRGRFRQHLLGKRVDYSGRSVIVVGPELKIYECGLPKQMAIELFQPFLIQQLRNKGIAFTTTAAKAIINERKPILWTILQEILPSHPVLLNRAPTLHRLGIQAFVPKLISGKAIKLHPLVCPAFNADFDGDQMAVHVPLSAAARAEAFNLLLACNHLLAPSSGQPLILPTQDMILGCYYLTIAQSVKKDFIAKSKPTEFYTDFDGVLEKYYTHHLELQNPIWVRWLGKVQTLQTKQFSLKRNIPAEIRCDKFGNVEFFYETNYIFHPNRSQSFSCFYRTTVGRILFHNLRLQKNF
jgi:DNA-directed RNA polymerase subunit beta'